MKRHSVLDNQDMYSLHVIKGPIQSIATKKITNVMKTYRCIFYLVNANLTLLTYSYNIELSLNKTKYNFTNIIMIFKPCYYTTPENQFLHLFGI